MIFKMDFGRMLRQIIFLVLIEAIIFFPMCICTLSPTDIYLLIPEQYSHSMVDTIQSLLPVNDNTAIILTCMHIVYFISCIFLIIYGSLSLSRDAASGKIEYLLVRPVSRRAIFTQRLIAGLITVVFSCTAMCAFGVAELYIMKVENILSGIYDSVSFSLRAFGIEVMFFLLSYMWSCICKTKTSAVCSSLLCFFGTYLMGVFPQVVEKMWITAYFSPYHYAFDSTLGWIKPTAAVSIALISLIIGAVAYNKSQFYEI